VTTREDLAAAWRRLLLGDDGRPHIGGALILADLEHYCAGSRSPLESTLETGNVLDPHKLACLEGRRQVWFRIKALLEPPKAPAKPQPPGVPYEQMR
jgi:hypothetical protein